MGQYYQPYIKNVRTDEVCTVYSFDWGSGMKLMESCYMDNPYVSAIVSAMREPCVFAMIGDYAEAGDVPEEHRREFLEAFGELHVKEECPYLCRTPDNTFAKDAMCTDHDFRRHRFVLDHMRKEYIDLDQIWKGRNRGSRMNPVNPLTILCAVGNGRGGGDYNGNNSAVGSWAFDTIQFVEIEQKAFENRSLPPRYSDYVPIEPDLNDR